MKVEALQLFVLQWRMGFIAEEEDESHDDLGFVRKKNEGIKERGVFISIVTGLAVYVYGISWFTLTHTHAPKLKIQPLITTIVAVYEKLIIFFLLGQITF